MTAIDPTAPMATSAIVLGTAGGRPSPAFDPIAAWAKLSAYLDSVSLADMAEACCIDLKTIGSWTGPAVCPRHECRSYQVHMIGPRWVCSTCGAAGGSAALFAAKTIGWREIPGDEDIARDFVMLAREAIFAGLIEDAPRDVLDIYPEIPGFDRWKLGQRGIFEGEERKQRLLAFARELLCTQMSGLSVLRAAWAWSTCFCRPALTASEVAAIVERAR